MVPHENFIEIAEDVIHVLYIAIAATYTKHVHPPRRTWETTLLIGLRRIGYVTRTVRETAMLVCLILSAATPDNKCIIATVALFDDYSVGNNVHAQLNQSYDHRIIKERNSQRSKIRL